MTHRRVTPEGQRLDEGTAKLARLGHQRLRDAGLANVGLPKLRNEMCKSCACQPGSVTNACLQTQLDFLKAVAEGGMFLCHAPNDGSICAGWAGARAEVVANPLPEEMLALLAKHEYSPPDEVAA